MTWDPRMDDDDLDLALRRLGIPDQAQPKTTAAALLTAARSSTSSPWGSPRLLGGILGGVLLLGGVGGWFAREQLGQGAAPSAQVEPTVGGEPVLPADPPLSSHPLSEPREQVRPDAAPRAHPARDPAASSLRLERNRGHTIMTPALPVEGPGPSPEPASIGREGSEPKTSPVAVTLEQEEMLELPAKQPPASVEEAAQAESGEQGSAPRRKRRPGAEDQPASGVSQHLWHDPATTLSSRIGLTAGGSPWQELMPGRAPMAGLALMHLRGGRSELRPLMGLELGMLAHRLPDETRAGSQAGALLGLGTRGELLRMDLSWTLGARWISAGEAALEPLDQEAGWLILESGPRLDLLIGDPEHPQLRVGAASPFSYLDLEARGQPGLVSWWAVQLGVDFPLHLSGPRTLDGAEVNP